MAKSSSSALVPAPPEQVWQTLADFGGISRWGTGVDQSSLLTDVSQGLGATRRVQVGRNAVRETITAWQPGKQLAYRLIGLPPVIREAVNTWELTAEGTATAVTLTAQVKTKGGPLIARLVARRLGRINKDLVAGLRDHHRKAAA